MSRMHISHGSGMSSFTTGPLPESVRLLEELRTQFEIQKKSRLCRFQMWLGQKFPRLRAYVDPSYDFEQSEARLLLRQRDETETSLEAIRRYKRTLQAKR
jgi:hypothetical protein